MAEQKNSQRAKHAHGLSQNLYAAIESGKVDAFDVIFLDAGTDNPKIGWLDKDGNPIVIDNQKVIVIEDENLPDSGEEGKVYIFKDNGYFWNGAEFINFCKPTDLTELEADITAIESELVTKIDANEVDEKIEQAVSKLNNACDDVNYLVSSKPDGTLVDYRDKEIRIMCPADAQWTLQNSGENADKNMYYIGIKAYAPSEEVVSFKEDTKDSIFDETMYYFEGEFAGIEEDGRKYSIIWLPAAIYDESTSTWTYYGEKSSKEKFIGWYYSVEWYNEANEIVASDCIRINLSNEECHSSIEPFYMTNVIEKANAYTDTQIETRLEEVLSLEIVEF